MYWLRLIRWQNLLIVFLTQMLAWGCVVLPLQHHTEVQLLLNPVNFLLLSFSTVAIAAAGYIINDYFDIKIDIINRPDTVILEKSIPLRMAILAHSALNIAGIIAAAVVARRAGHYSWLALQIGCSVMLWFYSTHFKRQFMIGNVVVALLTSFTIIALMLYEPAIHYYLSQPPFIPFKDNSIPNPAYVLGIYTCFAFTLTWMREIVKDMEDFKGDANEGCITMPIKWGLERSGRFTQALGIIAIVPLLFGAYKLINAQWIALGIYAIVLLAMPVAIWIFNLNKKATTIHYHTMSRWLKIIMVSGIGSLILYYFQTNG
ncbi:MAG: geranylgeranylglycerol-phosphate geranylgeranyltransferase [Bacteroidetes bacterium]|nr:geranylgeranylglycerol-phosphate geranylgeranyltransferase [Bacteroidota bacterium]